MASWLLPCCSMAVHALSAPGSTARRRYCKYSPCTWYCRPSDVLSTCCASADREVPERSCADHVARRKVEGERCALRDLTVRAVDPDFDFVVRRLVDELDLGQTSGEARMRDAGRRQVDPEGLVLDELTVRAVDQHFKFVVARDVDEPDRGVR